MTASHIRSPRRRALLAALPIALFPAAFHNRPAAARAAEDGDGAPMRDIGFRDGNDRDRHLSDFASRPVVLSFWATRCGPCVRELPQLDQLAADTEGDGLAVLAINVDNPDPAALRAFLSDHGAPRLAVFFDRSRMLLRTAGFSEIPCALVLDRAHRCVARATGPFDWADPGVERAIRSLPG